MAPGLVLDLLSEETKAGMTLSPDGKKVKKAKKVRRRRAFLAHSYVCIHRQEFCPDLGKERQEGEKREEGEKGEEREEE